MKAALRHLFKPPLNDARIYNFRESVGVIAIIFSAKNLSRDTSAADLARDGSIVCKQNEAALKEKRARLIVRWLNHQLSLIDYIARIPHRYVLDSNMLEIIRADGTVFLEQL